MFSSSTDSIRYILRSTLTRENSPDLFGANDKFTEQSIIELCSTGRASEITDWQNKESKVVWKSVKQCIEGFIAEDLDILVEGVAILPEFIAELDCDFSTVFIGNTNKDHGQIMLDFARSGSYDWMSKFSDEAILQFGAFTSSFSNHLQAEAKKYGYKYYDMGAGDYTANKLVVVESLLKI